MNILTDAWYIIARYMNTPLVLMYVSKALGKYISTITKEMIERSIMEGSTLSSNVLDQYGIIHMDTMYMASQYECVPYIKWCIHRGSAIYTLTRMAVFHMNTRCIRYMHTYDVHIIDSTLLHVACINNDVKMVKTLLDIGVPISKNILLMTNNVHITRLLLNVGAKTTSTYDLSPIHRVITNGNVDLLYLYVKYGDKLSQSVRNQYMAYAVSRGPTHIIRSMCSLGFNPYHIDHVYGTLLHVATINNREMDVITYLLDLGIDTNIVDYNGKKAIDYAITTAELIRSYSISHVNEYHIGHRIGSITIGSSRVYIL